MCLFIRKRTKMISLLPALCAVRQPNEIKRNVQRRGTNLPGGVQCLRLFLVSLSSLGRSGRWIRPNRVQC